MKKLDWKTLIRICVCIFLLYLAIHFWPAVAEFFGGIFTAATPVIAGLCLAYLLNLIMGFYLKHLFPRAKKEWVKKLGKGLSLVAALLTLFAIVGLVIGLVLPQLVLCIRLLIEKLPGVAQTIMALLEKNGVLSEYVTPILKNFNWQSFQGQAVDVLLGGFTGVVNVVTEVLSGTVTVFLTIIFAVYFQASKDRLLRQSRRVLEHFLPKKAFDVFCYVSGVLNTSFRRYIVGQCTEAVILGLLCGLGMTILQMPYAAMISTFIAFTALIPVAGAYIGAAVGAVMILTVSPLKALFFLIFIIILQQLEGNLIYPRVVGASLGLPGVWVLAAVTIGGSIMGVWGMLLGVPLSAACYTLLRDRLNQPKAEETAEIPKEEATEEAEPGKE